MTNRRSLVRICVCAALYAATLIVVNTVAMPYEWIEPVAYAMIFLAIGWDVLWRAVKNIAHGKLFDEIF